ncbi:hypothetical protein MPDQ_003808 [Monascus purpureus]|uniref:PBSP domain protein n=1 Tax=Monascus purpureus TaxID=5098 RepID=A0A507R127_MONPU|nr:hypothetical protein MPDQ_003808 [Monascus purpureus]
MAPLSSLATSADVHAHVPKPKFRLHLDDLRHAGSTSFLSRVPNPLLTLETALQAIIRHLYTSPTDSDRDALSSAVPRPRIPSFSPSIPPTRSVTLILRDFDGIAYTTGTDYDKEIHFSLSYIRARADAACELAGVLTHELVHCYQHTSPRALEADDRDETDAANSEKDSNIPHPPGGLIEGIADFVRLKAGLAPPHWKRPSSSKDRAENWDQGYQHTAYFLAWLEDVRVGVGAVGMLNDRLLRVGYVGESTRVTTGDAGENDTDGSGRSYQESFWVGLFGVGVLELWEEYGEYLNDHREEDDCKGKGNWEIEFLGP